MTGLWVLIYLLVGWGLSVRVAMRRFDTGKFPPTPFNSPMSMAFVVIAWPLALVGALCVGFCWLAGYTGLHVAQRLDRWRLWQVWLVFIAFVLLLISLVNQASNEQPKVEPAEEFEPSLGQPEASE